MKACLPSSIGARLNSILTISKDFSYGEITRFLYIKSSTQTYYLPSFIGALRATQLIRPNVLLLDIRQEDFLAAESFLIQLLEAQSYPNPCSPDIFLGQAAAAILRDVAGSTPKRLYPMNLPGAGQGFSVIVEPFQLESLIKQLHIALQKQRES